MGLTLRRGALFDLQFGGNRTYSQEMPSRGRHQSTSKECRVLIKKIEALEGVTGLIIGRSYGGRSLGRGGATGMIRVQREVPGGVKAVMQSEKGLQEVYIRTEEGMASEVAERVMGVS